jgi:3-hydroxyisobutyrate dehydrogenase-like beta-hydroxyacid dehydrogenase
MNGVGEIRMRTGFIGLGVQGLPLALNLLGAGHEVYGFDVAQEPLAILREAGGVIADDIPQIAKTCAIVFICVAKDEQVIEVVAGQNGLAAHAARGVIIVNHSTVSTETTARLIDATDAAGAQLVDAPVSGGAKGAQEKTMSFMVGGADDVLDICEPLFRLSGPTVLRTGPVGTATIGKLAHQVTIIGNILAMAEGMRLGVAGGLSPEIMKQVITGGLARSYIAETWGEIKMAPHAIPIYAKDLENSLKLAEQLHIELPGAVLMKQQLENIVP